MNAFAMEAVVNVLISNRFFPSEGDEA